jgi:N,N-dimethylformamidase
MRQPSRHPCHAIRVAVALVSTLWVAAAFAQTTPAHMPVVGYADRLSVQPGETIRFMVRSELPRYRADLVRLVHGDTNPAGPGYREEPLDSPINRDYPGRLQAFPAGSHVVVPDHPALRLAGGFTLAAWIYPTTPHKGTQGLLAKWSPAARTGYAMVIEEDGSLGLWLGGGGRVERVRSARSFTPIALRAGEPPAVVGREPLHTSRWYFVAATFDGASGKVTLYQEPDMPWPDDGARAVVDRSVALNAVGQNELPFLMAGLWDRHDANGQIAGAHYNGKMESPRMFNRALSRDEVQALLRGGAAKDSVAAWNFSADIQSRKITDASPNQLHGRTVQMPTRAVTGHNWTGRETDFRRAPEQYGAIHFHDDDLDDCGWSVDFELQVPANLKSGVYAARLRAGNGEDYVPFFVRPKKGAATAKIAFLFPTFSYLAYAQGRPAFPQLLSMYDNHSDGSGVAYASRLRPLLTHMRPKVHMVSASAGLSAPHGLSADLHFTSWMEAKGYQYDVITDEDLDAEGASLLAPYKVVLTGPHPEYYSDKMLDGIEQYLQEGGRLMYLGGNGFYWVTEMDPGQRHTKARGPRLKARSTA